VKAWSEASGLRLAPWQKALVERIYPPDPPLDRLLARRPDLAHTDYRGVLVRAAILENA
jgi:hypothetical protein